VRYDCVWRSGDQGRSETPGRLWRALKPTFLNLLFCVGHGWRKFLRIIFEVFFCACGNSALLEKVSDYSSNFSAPYWMAVRAATLLNSPFEVDLHSLASELDGAKWSALCSNRLIPRKETPCTHWIRSEIFSTRPPRPGIHQASCTLDTRSLS
jgi:hypothetical protein